MIGIVTVPICVTKSCPCVVLWCGNFVEQFFCEIIGSCSVSCSKTLQHWVVPDLISIIYLLIASSKSGKPTPGWKWGLHLGLNSSDSFHRIWVIASIVKCGMKLIWEFHPAVCDRCTCLSMMGLMLIHVSKGVFDRLRVYSYGWCHEQNIMAGVLVCNILQELCSRLTLIAWFGQFYPMKQLWKISYG